MALSVRQKRDWAKKLIAKQEAIEQAQEELAQEIREAHKAGLSAYAIASPLGSTSTTVRKILEGGRDPQ